MLKNISFKKLKKIVLQILVLKNSKKNVKFLELKIQIVYVKKIYVKKYYC